MMDLMEQAQKQVRESFSKLSPAEFAERVTRIHGDIGCKCPWCDLAEAYLSETGRLKP